MEVILLIIVGIIVYKWLKTIEKKEQTKCLNDSKINSLKEKEDWEGLLKYCRELLKSNPKNINLSLTIAYAYLKTYEYYYCIYRCDEVLKQLKDNEEALCIRAQVYSKIFMYEEALNDLNKALQVTTIEGKKQEYTNLIEKITEEKQAELPFEFPVNYNEFSTAQKIQYIRARYYEKENKFKKAKDLVKELPMQPNDFPMVRFYTNLLYQTEEYEDSKYFYNMIKFDTKERLTPEEEARCYYIDAVSEISEIECSNYDSYEIIELCYSIKRYAEKALKVCSTFKQANELISKSSQILYDRVIKYIENYIIDNPYDGDEEAYHYIDICEKLLKYEKNNLRYLYLTAQLYYIQGEVYYGMAIKTIKKILKLDANYTEAKKLLNKIEADIEEHEESELTPNNSAEKLAYLMQLFLQKDFELIASSIDKEVLEKCPSIEFFLYIMQNKLTNALNCVDKFTPDEQEDCKDFINALKKPETNLADLQISCLKGGLEYCLENEHYEQLIKLSDKILQLTNIQDANYILAVIFKLLAFASLKEENLLKNFLVKTIQEISENIDDIKVIEAHYNSLIECLKNIYADENLEQLITHINTIKESKKQKTLSYNQEIILELIADLTNITKNPITSETMKEIIKLLRKAYNAEEQINNFNSENTTEGKNLTPDNLYRVLSLIVFQELYKLLMTNIPNTLKEQLSLQSLKEFCVASEDKEIKEFAKLLEETPPFINELLQIQPNSPYPHLILSLFNMILYKYEDAKKEIDLVLQLDNEIYHTHLALAYFHLKSESSDKCKKSLDRARELFELSVDKNDENIVEEWNKNLMYIEQHLNEINDAVVIDTNKTRKLDL